MTLTGVFLSLTISCKMVGLFAFLSVGTAVAVDLWNLLDVKRGLTIVSSPSETSALPVRILTVNVFPTETILPPLCRPRRRPHLGPGGGLPLLVLGALYRLDQVGHRRRLYESGIPADSAG